MADLRRKIPAPSSEAVSGGEERTALKLKPFGVLSGVLVGGCGGGDDKKSAAEGFLREDDDCCCFSLLVEGFLDVFMVVFLWKLMRVESNGGSNANVVVFF